jgi:hypothetical protein
LMFFTCSSPNSGISWLLWSCFTLTIERATSSFSLELVLS